MKDTQNFAWRYLKSSYVNTLTSPHQNWEPDNEKDGTIVKFFVRLHDLANCLFALGENVWKKMAIKILKSIPKKFYMKVTAIEEAQDNNSIKVVELFGSLLNFELAINLLSRIFDKPQNPAKLRGKWENVGRRFQWCSRAWSTQMSLAFLRERGEVRCWNLAWRKSYGFFCR